MMKKTKFTCYIPPRADVKGICPICPLAISGTIGDMPGVPVYEEEF